MLNNRHIHHVLYSVTFLFWILKTTPLYLINSSLGLKSNGKHNVRLLKQSILKTFFYVRNYYILNDLIWQDGFLIDFLQKKVIDKWMRRFLIYSAYLFNERWLFDYVVRFYITLIIWPGYRINIYEFNNIASTLLITLFLVIIIFLIISLMYFWALLF
jgi:hypothetical protein